MQSTRNRIAATLAMGFCLSAGFSNADPPASFDALNSQYEDPIRGILKSFCLDCHSTERREGELDLQRFATLADVRRDAEAWQKVEQMLENGEMPPEDSEQPSDVHRNLLLSWVQSYLSAEALANAGDPGPVVLRRLNNSQYNYTIRDLTGIESLNPTGEFPVDGAAGEGFTNAGSAQGMSPSLVQKYLDAAKQVSEHVVLLPDGIGFSKPVTRRDRTDQLLARIQAFYREFTEAGGGSPVNLQGIQFDTNQGGRLPVEPYLTATLAARDALASGRLSIDDVARQHGLSAKFLGILWAALADDGPDRPSVMIAALQRKWRRASVADAPALAAEVVQAQNSHWKMNAIGHIGREGGPTAWLEPVTPVADQQEIRLAFPQSTADTDISIYLTAADLGDGNQQDFVVWENARIEFDPSRNLQPISLRDVRSLVKRIEASIQSEVPRTQEYLRAVVQVHQTGAEWDAVAADRDLNPRLLQRWADLVGMGNRTKQKISGHFTNRLTQVQGYDAVSGWGQGVTPSLLTNRSEDPISFLTLTVPARGVTVHPSPTLESVIAWRSPLQGKIHAEGLVADADDKCGNGAQWRIEVLSASGVSLRAGGAFDNGGNERFGTGNFDVRIGDVVSLVVNARDANHSCDTTQIQWLISELGGENRVWDLAPDIVDNILSSNPLPDSYGNAETWHFCATDGKPDASSPIPPGSALANWRAAVVESKPVAEIERLGALVQSSLLSVDPASLSESDIELRRLLNDWTGPLRWVTSSQDGNTETTSDFGLDPSRFGKHPGGLAVDPSSLCAQAPHTIEVRLPASLVSGAEFVATGKLHSQSGNDGSVQLQVLTSPNDVIDVSLSAPIIVNADSDAARRIQASMKEFRELFPAALCYARIVPVDEVVTLTLFHREDDHLKRLMLDAAQAAQLDRLWNELYFVSQEPLQLVVVFEQISEFATQDRPDLVKSFAPLAAPINERADRFRQQLLDAEPTHLNSVLQFADRAWRRRLTDVEQQSLRSLYHSLREAELPHDQAIRLTVARVLTSPAFLYLREQPSAGKTPTPVTQIELASRLSYFLWSSTPDAELAVAAETGQLSAGELLRQADRMLRDPRTRRLAIEFACQWLHVRDFDQTVEKNEKLYPEFASLRATMYEETVRFFEDLFRNDGSILGMINADHLFLNEPLAKHYGIAGVQGSHWRRVDGAGVNGRGGILGMATFLASQSGASRTSPILRGNWVYETLLGERLPRPPAGVPQLPEQAPPGVTARELIEQHSSSPACAKCHVRIDPYGFALEQYDAIGRIRPERVDVKTTLADQTAIDGIDSLRDYLIGERRDDVVRQFCRKLLGYALGRQVQLSDQPLLAEMQQRLSEHQYRFSVAVHSILSSRQFQQIRGGD